MYFQQDCPFDYIITRPCTYPDVYPGLYEISNDGRVFNIFSNVEIKQFINKKGYFRLCLKSTDGHKDFRVHRLVAWEFCNPPINYAELTVNHIDGNKLNNMYWNLEWCTNEENIHHAVKLGLIKHKPVFGEQTSSHKLTDQEVCEIYELLRDPNANIHYISRVYNISRASIYDIANGVTWTHITSQFPQLPQRVNNQYKLTEEQVHQIHQMKRRYPNMTYREIGDVFGVSLHCIFDILNDRSWQHIYSYYNTSSES